MLFRSRFCQALLIPGILVAGPVGAQVYTADISNSEWKVAVNPFVCSLTHNIPAFGKATLSRKAGGSESFILESLNKVIFPSGQAILETAPPAWRSDTLPIRVSEVAAVAGNQPINLRDAQIAPLVAQLSSGVSLMYASQPTVNKSSDASVMRVVLNAKNFSPAYKKYQQCVSDLIPYTFAQVARTSINYPEKPTGLTATNKSDLGKVARYIGADSAVVGVFVDGHSDNSGSAEERDATSKQAAEWVTAYLTERGVSAEKITTRWHADKFLIANNKTDAGRAQNRRVTVRLEDEVAHKEFMKKEEENRKASEKAATEKASVEKAVTDKPVAEKITLDKSTLEKPIADAKKASTSAGVAKSSSASTGGKMSPEEISRMVEGLDIVK